MKPDTTSRIGGWILTHSGTPFFPLSPRVEEVKIMDIAHALSMTCRFNGHCNEFYSVAEHSWRMSFIVPPAHALWALLHDASEAYIADVTRPIKPLLTNYQQIETKLMEVIAQKFGLVWPMPDCIAAADLVMLHTEKRDLLIPTDYEWSTTCESLLPDPIVPMSSRQARDLFLGRFTTLYHS